jgi:WD40 repeat protein
MNSLKEKWLLLISLLNELRYTVFGQDIFVSYRWNEDEKRKEYAQNLGRDLEERGLDCFVDTKRMTGGDDIPRSIENAIRKSRLFVLITTKDIIKSRWVPLELEIALKSNCRIVPVNVSKAVQSLPFNERPWGALENLNRVDESAAAHEATIPSESVSKEIRASFTFRRNRTRLLYYMLTIAVIILAAISSLGAYSWNLGSRIEEQTKSLNGLDQEIKNKNTEIQNKNTEIANKNRSLNELQTNLNTTIEQKTQAEANTNAAIIRQKEEEKKAIEANDKRKDAEAKERKAKAQQIVAEKAADAADRQAQEARLLEQGSRASSWSRQKGREYPAVGLALKAAKQIPATNAGSTKEVWNGLTDAIVNNRYSMPLANRLKKAEISPNGEVIFGIRFDENTKKSQWNLLDRKTQRTEVFYETDGEAEPPASFSYDGEWLVTMEGSRMKFWRIDDIKNGRKANPKECNVKGAIPIVVDMTVNKNGETAAVKLDVRKRAIEIALIERENCKEVPIEYNFNMLSPESVLLVTTHGMIFNSSDELILNHDLAFKKPSNVVEISNNGYVYNATKQKLLCSNAPFGQLSTQTESGDLVFESALRGIYKAIVFSPSLCEQLYAMESKNRIQSVAVNSHRFVMLEKSKDNTFISDSFFSDKFAVFPIYNYLLTGVRFFDGDNYLLTSRDLSPFIEEIVAGKGKFSTDQLFQKKSEGWEEIILPPRQRIFAVLRASQNSPSTTGEFSYFSLSQKDGKREIGVWNPKTQSKSKSCQLDDSIPGIIRFISRIEMRSYALIDNPSKIILLHNNWKISIVDQSCQLVKQISLDQGAGNVDQEDIFKFSVSGNSIAIITRASTDPSFKVRIWDLDNVESTPGIAIQLPPSVEAEVPGAEFPYAVSPVGRMIFTRKKDNFSLFQIRNNKLVNLGLPGFESFEAGFATFSDDGKFLGLLDDEGIRIWDLLNGHDPLLIHVPNVTPGRVLSPFDFSSDGKSIAVVGSDGNIRIYPTSKQEYINIAEAITKQ